MSNKIKIIDLKNKDSYRTIFVFTVLGLFFFSCKKQKIPASPATIYGPTNLCPGQTNIVYSINPVSDANYYLWTVPQDAKIISGQGTTSITIGFGKKSGTICVRANNDKEVSQTTCIDIQQGGISNQWCQELNFLGGVREQGFAFSINNKGYFGTGFSSITNTKYNDFWEFDPLENTWSQKANFAGSSRVDAVAFVINNKAYVGTGFGSGPGADYLADFWEYNPQTNVWTKKADYVSGCAYCFAFSIGNKGYVGSGSYKNTPVASNTDFYEFDPLNGSLGSWTKKANLLSPSNSASGFSIGNKGYYGLGSNLSVYSKKFMEYDPTDLSNGTDINGNPNGKWVFKSTFAGNARDGAVSFSINTKGYISCGYDSDFYYFDFWEYDPNTDTWLQKPNLPSSGRKYAVGFSIANNGYVGLGANQLNSLDDFWVYGQ